MNAYTLAAIPPTLLLIARPQLWLWALAVAAFVALAAVGAAAHVFRSERNELRAELDRRNREDAATVPVPLVRHLRVVESDEIPQADESWLDEITKPGGWS